jgi:hypothetical protein
MKYGAWISWSSHRPCYVVALITLSPVFSRRVVSTHLFLALPLYLASLYVRPFLSRVHRHHVPLDVSI